MSPFHLIESTAGAIASIMLQMIIAKGKAGLAPEPHRDSCVLLLHSIPTKGQLMGRNRQLGQATVALMKAITEGHRFGLDIMEATGLPSGTVYPTLARLEQRGYLGAAWEPEEIALGEGRPKRRYYEITSEGEIALADAIRRFGFLASSTDARQAMGGT